MTDQMTDRNRWIALYVLCAGMLMIVLDVTVVNVALPSIQNDLGFAQSSLAWVVYAFVASAGGSVGLLAGGILTQSINWHWIFFVNIPIGIATAVLAMRLLEKDKGIGFGDGADVPGAVLITSSLMLGVYTIVKPAAENGWGSGRTLGLGAVSLLLLVAFVVREVTARNPPIPLRI